MPLLEAVLLLLTPPFQLVRLEEQGVLSDMATAEEAFLLNYGPVP